MLPQGEFKKLLEASSGEKEAILRTIFHTDYLDRFQQAIAERFKQANQEVGTLKKQVDQHSQSFVTFADNEAIAIVENGDEEVDTADKSLTEKDRVQNWVDQEDYKNISSLSHTKVADMKKKNHDLTQQITLFKSTIQRV